MMKCSAQPRGQGQRDEPGLGGADHYRPGHPHHRPPEETGAAALTVLAERRSDVFVQMFTEDMRLSVRTLHMCPCVFVFVCSLLDLRWRS